MVRFPNGSRTHISLSAEASLKVSTVSKLAAATPRERFPELLQDIGKLNTSSSEGLNTFLDTKHVAFFFRTGTKVDKYWGPNLLTFSAYKGKILTSLVGFVMLVR